MKDDILRIGMLDRGSPAAMHSTRIASIFSSGSPPVKNGLRRPEPLEIVRPDYLLRKLAMMAR